METRSGYLWLVLTVFAFGAVGAVAQEVGTNGSDVDLRSPYAGQEQRAIKTLSEDDLRQLRAGEGWGLAKAAELNGVPGPAHVLSLAASGDLSLTSDQMEHVQSLYDDVKARAKPLGERLIAEEQELNRLFASGSLSELELDSLLRRIGETTAALRYVHLSAHLLTLRVLTAPQVHIYNMVRGYMPDATSAGTSSPTSVHGH